MKPVTFLCLALLLIVGCKTKQPADVSISTADIDHFWHAYDQITATSDTLEQAKYLQELYIDRGSPGLAGIMQVRDYTVSDYLHAIRAYPLFWASIRENTYRTQELVQELSTGVNKLRDVYPQLKPAYIYFTIGALRTNGTALDSLVLIGSELAMADQHTVSTEFPPQSQKGRRAFFDSNPIHQLVLLNMHEYVHTQQQPIVHNLLSQCLYEGVAEFVSVTAMGVPSAAPAIPFGKSHEDAVRKQFEAEMFQGNKTYQWLWSDAENQFHVRDLGYYIGYEIAERYYQQAADKRAAIREMIELDYTDEPQIEAFVDGTGFFSASLAEMYDAYEADRPTVVNITPFENGSQTVRPRTTQLTVTFSEPMDPEARNFDYGPLGEAAALRLKRFIGIAEDGKSVTFEVDLAPDTHYQLTIGSGFRDESGMPLRPYLIDFKTEER